MVIERKQVEKPVKELFPFGVEYQKALIKLLTVDVSFGNTAIKYLRPEFFENDVLSWVYTYLTTYQSKYNAIPPLRLILEETKNLDVSVREIYRLTLESVENADLSVEEWLRDKTLDFIKRNLFVAAFKESRYKYNLGEVGDAYDLMMGAMDEIYKADWETPDREWFFDEFTQRTSDRLSHDPTDDAVSTGIPELDQLLSGGLSLGEMGVWVAYPKRGKTTLLINHGVQAVRRGNRNVLHVVLEGSRKMVANRYDTVFAKEVYAKVKSGNFTEETYKKMSYDYNMYQRRLVIRGFTERWDYSVTDIHEELRELKRLHNWVPALIIVDYGDLLRSRIKTATETETQRAAFRDLKSLANRGYALWTASQAQRPSSDIDSNPQVLYSRKIADCYDKVRVADFLGSINQTSEERSVNQMRLFGELYRDNEASKIIPVKADFARMLITVVRSPGESVLPSPIPAATALGYTIPPTQRKASLK